MKNLKYIIPLLLLLVFSCKKSDLKNFDGTSDIYWSNIISTQNSLLNTDSAVFSFAFGSAKVTDTLLKLPVKIMGFAASEDRAFRVKAQDSSTMVAGKHYDALPESFIMHANKIIDTVTIRIHRTPDMLKGELTLYLELLPNENFTASLKTYKKMTATVTKIKASDVIIRPKYWLDAYLGVFSRKKALMLIEIVGVDMAAMNNTAPDITNVAGYGRSLQQYLDEQRVAGNIIYEEDGITEMTMGGSI
ncbi:DUF4843 domain-containing protein [Chitinophaga sp. Cy-1792]|uniref:DUF4843 domain-containing protein n=1 Tax=Chitinophaga sp. Cy-1792 TaxID=2608339 RepID=UPI001423F797|nr:DUF4843 domain-containing protein [Chitinophaga sp. Cy-1792]